MVPGSRSMVKSFKLQALEFPDQLKATSADHETASYKLDKAIIMGYSRIMNKIEVRKLYQKQTKKKLVDECVLLYEHVQKLGKEKMIRELSDGLNDYKK